VDPLAVAQRIFVKFLTNGNVKSAEILNKLRAQFGDETLSGSQVYDRNKSFKEAQTEVENMRRLQLLQRKLRPELLGLSMRLIHRLADRTTNHQLSLLFEATSRPSKVSLSFKSTRSLSQKRQLCPGQRASAQRRCDSRYIGGNALRGSHPPPP
jgi:hypothetical protein